MNQPIERFRGEHFFLSNFFPCEFDVPGLGRVRSGEQAYQALKTEDHDARRKILTAESAAEAKLVGQTVPRRPDWEVGGRVSAMLDVVSAKFSLPELADRLRGTGHAPLTEGNEHHDNFWGDCRCGAARCADPGFNVLGELLMVVRVGIGEASPTDSSQAR